MDLEMEMQVELTKEYVRRVLDYNPSTGVITRKIGGPRTRVGAVVGCITRKGYLSLKLGRKTHLAHRIAWFHYYGEWPLDQLDHINWITSTGIDRTTEFPICAM